MGVKRLNEHLYDEAFEFHYPALHMFERAVS